MTQQMRERMIRLAWRDPETFPGPTAVCQSMEVRATPAMLEVLENPLVNPTRTGRLGRNHPGDPNQRGRPALLGNVRARHPTAVYRRVRGPETQLQARPLQRLRPDQISPSLP